MFTPAVLPLKRPKFSSIPEQRGTFVGDDVSESRFTVLTAQRYVC